MTTPNDKTASAVPTARLSRRAFLEGAAVAGAASIAAPFINRGRFQLFANTAAEYSARAIALVQRSTVVDMLCILSMNFAQADKWMKEQGSKPRSVVGAVIIVGIWVGVGVALWAWFNRHG